MLLRVRHVQLTEQNDPSTLAWRQSFHDARSPWARQVPPDVYVVAASTLYPNMPRALAEARPAYRCAAAYHAGAKLSLHVLVAPTVVLLPQPGGNDHENNDEDLLVSAEWAAEWADAAAAASDDLPATGDIDNNDDTRPTPRRPIFVARPLAPFQKIVERDAICIAFAVAPNIRFVIVHASGANQTTAMLKGLDRATPTVLCLSSAESDHVSCCAAAARLRVTKLDGGHFLVAGDVGEEDDDVSRR